MLATDAGRVLGDIAPRSQLFSGTLLKDLLKKVSEIGITIEGDAFGRIYDTFIKSASARSTASAQQIPSSYDRGSPSTTVLVFQIRNLRATRDLLLPRLMSGQVRLEEAEYR